MKAAQAAAALLGAALAAQAQVVDIDWGANGEFERSFSLAPGKFAEVCGPLAKGQAVDWAFDADAPLDFNVHYHAGKEVVFPARQDGVAKAGGKLQAQSAQDYCWMWSNPSAQRPAALRVSLRR